MLSFVVGSGSSISTVCAPPTATRRPPSGLPDPSDLRFPKLPSWTSARRLDQSSSARPPSAHSRGGGPKESSHMGEAGPRSPRWTAKSCTSVTGLAAAPSSADPGSGQSRGSRGRSPSRASRQTTSSFPSRSEPHQDHEEAPPTHRSGPTGVRRFPVAVFSDEMVGRSSFASLAVKLRQDDIEAWTRHALLRSAAWGRLAPRRRDRSSLPPASASGPLPATTFDGNLGRAADSRRRSAIGVRRRHHPPRKVPFWNSRPTPRPTSFSAPIRLRFYVPLSSTRECRPSGRGWRRSFCGSDSDTLT